MWFKEWDLFREIMRYLARPSTWLPRRKDTDYIHKLIHEKTFWQDTHIVMILSIARLHFDSFTSDFFFFFVRLSTYRTPSLSAYSSLSAKPFFWKTAMTALWMLQHKTFVVKTDQNALKWNSLCCSPVPCGISTRPLLLLPSVLWRTLLTLSQLAQTGGAHQLQPVQSPHEADRKERWNTLNTGQEKKQVRRWADIWWDREETRGLRGRKERKQSASEKAIDCRGKKLHKWLETEEKRNRTEWCMVKEASTLRAEWVGPSREVSPQNPRRSQTGRKQ